jgi:glycosyltransferase involved in cell wall biosynthesis
LNGEAISLITKAMTMAAGGDRPPLLWMDVTTSWRNRGGQANGTLRVEGSYAASLTEIMGPDLRFCRYSRTRGQLAPAARPPHDERPARRAHGPGAARPTTLLADLGRRAERALRQSWRSNLASIYRRLDAYTLTPPFPAAAPGDVLLLAGETWAQHDIALLGRLRREQGLRLAAVCQDLIPVKFPQFFPRDGFVERYRAYADFLVGEVDLLIAISNSTKADLVDHARARGGVRGRLKTVQLGADFDLAKTAERPAALPEPGPAGFVLSVSTIQSRKNFDLLYRLWHRFAEQGLANLPRLVIVGQPGFGSADLLHQIAADPIAAPVIAVLHHVTDGELAWLYRNCRWTLYPSFYEGWGLPISESLAHGKHCMASDTSSLPEAGQGLIWHGDPLDFAAWAEAVAALTHEPGKLAALEAGIRAGYRPVTWRQSAECLRAMLGELLAA